MTRRTWFWSAFIVGLLAFALLIPFGRPIWTPIYVRFNGGRTVSDVLEQFGPRARVTWAERFGRRNLKYPPENVTLVALKRERIMEVWASRDGSPVLVHTYPILAASGTLGPKLKQGDLQVPEGIYAIEGLNPNSSFHLSMKVNYPNETDLRHANDDGRTNLGGDIFIHGKRASIGCLAMGDPAIEELFVLVADAGRENTDVIITPCDFRTDCQEVATTPAWTRELYGEIRASLAPFAVKK